ncbi:hypothetical protein LSAT2_006315 [Lamellibrachia satsuma]|nr:hypothetical protein LSAT2_006315 [Lamellibrachia satsuma]
MLLKGPRGLRSIKTGLSKTKKTNARWNMITPMLRLSKECTLQLVAMNSQGKAHLLSEVPLGHNTRHLTVSRSGLRCVTWCSLPVEQRIHYWDMSTVEIKKLATFTPEETVGDVTFINDTDDIAINCASGLIKLQLCGTSVKQQVSMLTDDPILFHGTDLDVQLTKV